MSDTLNLETALTDLLACVQEWQEADLIHLTDKDMQPYYDALKAARREIPLGALIDCREAFERWGMTRGGAQMNLNKDEAGYCNDWTQEAWVAWKAAWDYNLPSAEDVRGILAPSEIRLTNAEALKTAWDKYTYLFGEAPHGTEKQMAALAELLPKREAVDLVTAARALEGMADHPEWTPQRTSVNGARLCAKAWGLTFNELENGGGNG